jgi:hypothetical protein
MTIIQEPVMMDQRRPKVEANHGMKGTLRIAPIE